MHIFLGNKIIFYYLDHTNNENFEVLQNTMSSNFE